MSVSAYETLREQNIARNHEVLKSLGFVTVGAMKIENPTGKTDNMKEPHRANLTKLRPKAWEILPFVGPRSSKRLKAESAEAISIDHKDAHAVNTDTSRSCAKLLRRKSNNDDCTAQNTPTLLLVAEPPLWLRSSRSIPAITWDMKRMHQHLQLSASGRTVMTTGCAGYGGVLAGSEITATVLKNTNSKSIAATWKVKCRCEGVGGFSVGVCIASASGPYKSFGNRPDSWVLHSSGKLLHNRQIFDVSNCPDGYMADDEIEVRVSQQGQLSFVLNGSANSVIATDKELVLAAGKYILCCQPYMGGSATIL